MRPPAIDKRPAGSNATLQACAVAAHNLKLCPIILDILAMISAERRVGPLQQASRKPNMNAYARE
jgi:hypothetical protein